ncbi:MAG: hypothetical protein GY765_04470 [bacterium]|nr:hypothetical protein [bacterium]
MKRIIIALVVLFSLLTVGAAGLIHAGPQNGEVLHIIVVTPGTVIAPFLIAPVISPTLNPFYPIKS